MQVHSDALISAISASGIVVALAKYVITKALRDLERLSQQVIKIDKDLTAVSVRLEKLNEHEQTLKELNEKLGECSKCKKKKSIVNG